MQFGSSAAVRIGLGVSEQTRCKSATKSADQAGKHKEKCCKQVKDREEKSERFFFSFTIFGGAFRELPSNKKKEVIRERTTPGE